MSAPRYQIHGVLGRGGVAVVYDATDLAQGRRLALKRLQELSNPEKHRRNRELFEREFHTLSQLAHPRVVEVYDFGVDDSGAYYTMELLEGGDLQELAPMPWRRACAVARDVCSALSLLHSRRFVHRDISPRNVRCLKEGPAKLIDFGAMAPMGPTKLLVGTPPCCAPESVQLQGVDPRTDLYSLGATLYYLLVGHHAYAAREFTGLPALWRLGFVRPADLVREIPSGLDALVMDLLRLEPDARPSSAAEVLERLSAIDGDHSGEQLKVAQAYLSTPTLIARDEALARVQRRLRRPAGGRTRSVVIDGRPGVGRTRLLDACVLDASLAGKLVVRSDADDAVSGNYGVARAIGLQLLQHAPAAACAAAQPVIAALRNVLPELDAEHGTAGQEPSTVPRPIVQRALQQWLSSLCRARPFVVAIDDFHRIDEPSAALFALIESESSRYELCLLLTVEADATWSAESARKLLLQTTRIPVENLSLDDTEKLLRGLFGAVPNLSLLAHGLFALCEGNPRALMSLAQHLIDRGAISYRAGAWTLPARLDAAELPASLGQALAARVASLSAPAFELACALALASGQGFTFAEVGELAGNHEPAAVVAALDELLSAEIARQSNELVIFGRPSWASPILATLTRERERERALHRRLASVYERRSEKDFRAARHLFCAAEPGRALDILVPHAEYWQLQTTSGPEILLGYVLSLPSDWFQVFEQGLRACDELARPPREKFVLLNRLVGIMSLLSTHAAQHFNELFRHLRRDSGLDDLPMIDMTLDPLARIRAAIAQARARYDATPARDRVLDPQKAIQQISRAIVSAIGPIMMALDVAALRALPSLAPFRVLSPALDVSQRLVEGVEARCSGRFPLAKENYIRLLELLDGAGLGQSTAQYIRLGVMNALGMIEASQGLTSSLKWAELVETSPAYEVNAAVIRMLERLFQGDVRGAEAHQQKADRLRIQNMARQMYEGGHLLWEVHAHALSGDLTRMRRVIEELTRMAKSHPHWEPVLRYALAEHHRLVRDPRSALGEIEAVLAGVQVGTHQIWLNAALCHVSALLELNEYRQALEVAERHVGEAEGSLGFVPENLTLVLGLARAQLGDESCAALVSDAIARLNALGVTGLHLGLAYETRARVALLLDETEDFARYTELCRATFLLYENSALSGRYHRLLQEGRRKVGTGAERVVSTMNSAARYNGSLMELALASCSSDEQRARLALTLLLRESRAESGMLFQFRPEGLFCVAQIGTSSPDSDVGQRVESYIAAQQAELEASTQTESKSLHDVSAWRDSQGRECRLLEASHFVDGKVVVTGVVVLMGAGLQNLATSYEAVATFSRAAAQRGATTLLLEADLDLDPD